MKRISLLATVVLLSVTWMVAQSSPSASTSDSQTSIQGCLSGSTGSYTLTDQSGKTYQLGGDTSKLTDHVGQEVELTGQESGGSSAGATPSSPPKSSMPSNSEVKFNVSKVKKISDTCTTSKK